MSSLNKAEKETGHFLSCLLALLDEMLRNREIKKYLRVTFPSVFAQTVLTSEVP